MDLAYLPKHFVDELDDPSRQFRLWIPNRNTIMPALGNISINDGKTTPVAHVFAPVDASGGRAQLANRAAALPAAWETLNIDVVAPAGKSASHQVVLELIMPVTATVNGVDTVVRTSKAKCFLYLSQQGSTQERDDLCTMVSGAFAHATVKTVVENIEPLY